MLELMISFRTLDLEENTMRHSEKDFMTLVGKRI